jgi:hypothetical protein
MNALQIIPPKPAANVRRSALLFRVSDAILLLALVGGMSMSRGGERTASEPGAAVVIKDSRDEVGSDDKSPAVTQPAAASTEASSSGGSDEKASASAQAIALPATPPPAGVENDPKVGGEAGKPAAAGTKSDTAVSAAIDNRNTHDRDSSRALAKPSTTSPASVALKNDPAPKPEDARVRKTASKAIAARSAEPARRTYQPRGEVGYRSWNSTDGMAVRIGPPPIIYGPSPEARAPYGAGLADGMKRQDRISLAAITGTWQRVVNAPGAVLNGGKQALYGILDSVW